MKKIRFQTDGFTIIELLVFVLALSIVAVLALTNVRTIRAENRDTTSKTDINAIFYQLESFREKNGYYPEALTAAALTGINPESLKDSDNLAPNAPGSKYLYKPASCTESKCKSFEISAQLEKEAPFVKESLSK